MNCNEFLTTMHHRFDLPAVHREGFEDHAGACAACADLLEEAVALDRVLSLWSAPEPPQSLSAAVMEAVQNATAAPRKAAPTPNAKQGVPERPRGKEYAVAS